MSVAQLRKDYEEIAGSGNGTFPVAAGLIGREVLADVKKLIIKLDNHRIAITDTGGANGGYGSQKIFDAPAGNIKVLGGVQRFTRVARVSTGIAATAVVKFSVGSAAEATNDTLDSAQADVIPSTNMAAMSSGVSAGGGGRSTAEPVLNGTVTPIDLFLNVGIADASISASDNIDVDGEIELYYINLGDI